MGSAGDVDAFVVTQKSDMNFTDLAQLAERRYGELFTQMSPSFPAMGQATQPAQLYFGLCKAREELWHRYNAALRARLKRQQERCTLLPPCETEEDTQQCIVKLTEFINRHLTTLSVP